MKKLWRIYKINDHLQVAQAHEEVAYATYVEKYTSGKSIIQLAKCLL